MLDFEEELKNFEPSREVDEAEDALFGQDAKDVTDIMADMIRQIRRLGR